ncbi:long-chain fatty acid--CoA ligase [Nostoc linckia z18]|uniref:Long-chain fatty acid--CoA ligase n=2 Tax=Nostoc linckia TaxID=92942 RepID=A0A9Q5ZDU3_NOSLI|nr:ABC transporter ATP-binding protein [Nostoc linckia]PHK40060.1 long-chain fatty acid--CoA ligase [Nostoc linckia z15]PHK47024.1 long-chain fatty acid--CoA ligase [Nostoc linckia z16]PHJ61547.1 long-chain fatty acid--CoA ligase [Nostoc linckia z1]PHJ65827.1 long-chain fatty acid--CoA ligase [Nostoc linckia z3]PHJ72111.1 long-chain fatty acid--CoA ligase [Nostoc linckia z2]
MSIYQSLNKKSYTQHGRGENDWRLFLRLVPYARRSGTLLALSMFLLVPLAIANAVQPLLIGQVISLIRKESSIYEFLRNRPFPQALNILEGLLLISIVIRLVLTGYQGYLVQKLGQQITTAIRQDLFQHVTSLAVRFFDRTPVGKLITRITSDVEVLGDVFSTGAIGILSDFLSMLVIIALMFSIQWQLACLLLLMLLPISWVTIYLQKQYRKANYKGREELSILNSQLQENVVGINVVQLFRREKFNAELFRATNNRYTQQVDKNIFYDAAVSATLEWIGLVAIAGVLWLGGLMLLDKELTFGTLSAFILYAQRLFDPLRNFAEKFTVIQAGFTAIERVGDVLDEPIEIRDRTNVRYSILDAKFGYIDEIVANLESPDLESPPELGEIRFEHVWFAYKNDDYVIKDLDFTIHPGEKIALVGPTGAGKTSIIRLLCRLYEPTQGRILIDGIDIREVPQAELRRYMAVILQDGFVFAGDVKSNISLGDGYTIEQIQQAAEKTNIAQFIEELPNSYDTQLRERGTNLSSGQKQLLAFARAAIRDPQILVLDEATASLDVGTEALIQEALDQLLFRRTAIIIAHRLSTIRNVDRIFVLKRGELIEEGSHEQLLQQGGLYATLHNLQMLGS